MPGAGAVGQVSQPASSAWQVGKPAPRRPRPPYAQSPLGGTGATRRGALAPRLGRSPLVFLPRSCSLPHPARASAARASRRSAQRVMIRDLRGLGRPRKKERPAAAGAAGLDRSFGGSQVPVFVLVPVPVFLSLSLSPQPATPPIRTAAITNSAMIFFTGYQPFLVE